LKLLELPRYGSSSFRSPTSGNSWIDKHSCNKGLCRHEERSNPGSELSRTVIDIEISSIVWTLGLAFHDTALIEVEARGS
jgi:hypothetical protein